MKTLQKFLAVVALLALLMGLSAAPVEAQSTQSYRFHAFYDGNGNGLMDYSGSDWCIRGNRTLTVYGTGPGIQPLYYITLAGSDYQMTTLSHTTQCIYYTTSPISITAPNPYRIIVSGSSEYKDFSAVVGSDPTRPINQWLKTTAMPSP